MGDRRSSGMAGKVLVIGAGASGLAAIKCCLDEGLDVICFEKSNDIGGLWNYTEAPVHGRGGTYKSCTINTSKEMMAFSDFPVPKHYPTFLPHRYVCEYLTSYKTHFKLDQYIQFGVEVASVERSKDYVKTGKWDVSFISEQNKDPGLPEKATFDYVMVCTGHHVYPNIPTFPGSESFHGHILHSHDYKRPDFCTDKKVVVVGIGNSGVDIAVDLSRRAKQTYLSTRRGAWVISRMGPLGIPADALANSRFLFSLPQSWLQNSVEIMANFRFDHVTYGVKPNHRALEAHPTINDELPFRIMTGAVKVTPQISHFTETGVHFENGSYVDADVVVLATGYEYKYPFLQKDVLPMEDNEASLYKFVFAPELEHKTLAMIGLVQAVGAVIPISEIQSRWATRVFTGKCTLPSVQEMKLDTKVTQRKIHRQYISSKRHRLQTFWIEYMDLIATKIGAKPNILNLLRKDASLAFQCFFGPCVPAQYRLQGPGTWTGARDVIMNSIGNSTSGLSMRPEALENTGSRWWQDFQTMFCVVFVVVFLCYFGLLTM